MDWDLIRATLKDIPAYKPYRHQGDSFPLRIELGNNGQVYCNNNETAKFMEVFSPETVGQMFEQMEYLNAGIVVRDRNISELTHRLTQLHADLNRLLHKLDDQAKEIEARESTKEFWQNRYMEQLAENRTLKDKLEELNGGEE